MCAYNFTPFDFQQTNVYLKKQRNGLRLPTYLPDYVAMSICLVYCKRKRRIECAMMIIMSPRVLLLHIQILYEQKTMKPRVLCTNFVLYYLFASFLCCCCGCCFFCFGYSLALLSSSLLLTTLLVARWIGCLFLPLSISLYVLLLLLFKCRVKLGKFIFAIHEE